MKAAPSLALRVALCLLVAQVLGASITIIVVQLHWATQPEARSGGQWNDLAEHRMTDLIVQSIRRAEDGRLFFEPIDALREEYARSPKLEIAILYASTNEPIEGSAPRLADLFSRAPAVRLKHSIFTLADEPDIGARGHVEDVRTPYGRMRIAMFGHLFDWTDVLGLVSDIFPEHFNNYAIDIVGVMLIGWLALKRGHMPLRRLAREAERIELDSLHQRLPTEGVPAEIMPLVTAMNSALARLDESAERQRRFLANAAHELRTPVAILVERLYGPEEPQQKNLIRRDVARLENLVEQLLSNARLDRQSDKSLGMIDLVAIAESVLDDHALLAAKMRRNIALEHDGAQRSARGDRRAAESVVANLLTNALRAEPEGGTVTLRVGDMTIEVVDHGEGVPAEERGAVFEPFWRKCDAEAGTGLGLAIAKELMEKLGGRIWVEETPGGGATFKLKFWMAQTKELGSPEEPYPSPRFDIRCARSPGRVSSSRRE
ncbi:HAMP domain-containing sensor histidine kinase [Methylosinus sp. LW3]|uniref:sensor histidine kinase n=1 Tax=Methylosinus sp. LW3 TaxID=107635 RepID=UPI000464C7C1|nr:HAMP domain-containing sensor histidine kinase [Methylosinus sp. LW3]